MCIFVTSVTCHVTMCTVFIQNTASSSFNPREKYRKSIVFWYLEEINLQSTSFPLFETLEYFHDLGEIRCFWRERKSPCSCQVYFVCALLQKSKNNVTPGDIRYVYKNNASSCSLLWNQQQHNKNNNSNNNIC